jgi:hypothetical protein
VLQDRQGLPEVGAVPGEESCRTQAGDLSASGQPDSETAGPRRLGPLEGAAAAAAAAAERVAAGGTMRRGGLLEVALAFALLLESYTSHGADANLEAGSLKETRANRAKRRGGGGHDALKG